MVKGNIITENELLFDVPADNQQSTPIASYLQRLEGHSLKGMIAELEREIISYSLEKHKGNVAQATNELQIGKTAFYEKMKRYEIIPKELK